MSKTRKYKRLESVNLFVTRDVNSNANFVWTVKPEVDNGLYYGGDTPILISASMLKTFGIDELSEGTCVEVRMMIETVRTDFLGRLIPIE